MFCHCQYFWTKLEHTRVEQPITGLLNKGRLLALLTNIKLRWKGQNTLAYYSTENLRNRPLTNFCSTFEKNHNSLLLLNLMVLTHFGRDKPLTNVVFRQARKQYILSPSLANGNLKRYNFFYWNRVAEQFDAWPGYNWALKTCTYTNLQTAELHDFNRNFHIFSNHHCNQQRQHIIIYHLSKLL